MRRSLGGCAFEMGARDSPVGGRFTVGDQEGFSSLRQRLAAGYTFGMKTAISIPDEVYAGAERLARKLRKSRSQLYSEAVADYVARHDPEAVTEAMNRVCEEVGDRADPAVSAAARRILQRTEWE